MWLQVLCCLLQSLCEVLLKEGLCCLAILCEKQKVERFSEK